MNLMPLVAAWAVFASVMAGLFAYDSRLYYRKWKRCQEERKDLLNEKLDLSLQVVRLQSECEYVRGAIRVYSESIETTVTELKQLGQKGAFPKKPEKESAK